jgi:hypothetical protein
MNADTITTTLLDELATLLDTAAQTIRRCRLMAANGDLGPDDAERIVRETAATINQFCETHSP